MASNVEGSRFIMEKVRVDQQRDYQATTSNSVDGFVGKRIILKRQKKQKEPIIFSQVKATDFQVRIYWQYPPPPTIRLVLC